MRQGLCLHKHHAQASMEDCMESETQTGQMAMPPVKNGLLPYITVDGALKAAEFYEKAFGAEQAFVVPPDENGRTMHVHLYINGSSLMLSDAYPEHGHPFRPHQGFSLQLVVDDIDLWWDRAVKAGVEVVMPVERMFWGDRYGQLRDPFGVSWAMNEPPRLARSAAPGRTILQGAGRGCRFPFILPGNWTKR
jgi:uncharacterized glyoxalase superfamily protein PhnB